MQWSSPPLRWDIMLLLVPPGIVADIAAVPNNKSIPGHTIASLVDCDALGGVLLRDELLIIPLPVGVLAHITAVPHDDLLAVLCLVHLFVDGDDMILHVSILSVSVDPC